MVFHTEAMTAIDEQRSVAPYACGPFEHELVRLWMPTTDFHQQSLAQVLDFMTTRGRMSLPGVVLREPDGARPNQVAVAAGGIRVGRLPDEVAAEVAGPLAELKNKGWLSVGELTFVTAPAGVGDEYPDGDGAGDGAGGVPVTIGCRLRLPDMAALAAATQPRR